MVNHIALRFLSTSSGARVGTFIPDAGSVPWAVVVKDAFGSASGVRVSLVLGQASAYAVVAFGVGSARGRMAWITFLRFGR